MIFLLTGTTNTISMNLSNYTTLTGNNVYYNFRFYSDDNKIIDFYTPDISTDRDLNQIYEITLTGGTEDLFNGTFDMDSNEKWRYRIYQSNGANIDSRQPIKALDIIYDPDVDFLSEGFVWINNIPNKLPIISYTDGDDDEIIVYK